jgi:hypothetical protein
VLAEDRTVPVPSQGDLDAGRRSGAIPVERCSAAAYVVAEHIAYLVGAVRAVASHVFQEPAVDRHYAVTNSKRAVAW